MKKIIFVMLLVSTQVFAGDADRTERMRDLLTDSGIEIQGRTEWQSGNFTCRLDKKTLSIYSCKLRAVSEGYYGLIRTFTPEESVEVVSLLKEFNMRTWGKRKLIGGEIECRVPKRSKLLECKEVDNLDLLAMPMPMASF